MINRTKKEEVQKGQLSLRGIIVPPHPTKSVKPIKREVVTFNIGDKVEAKYKMKGKCLPGKLFIRIILAISPHLSDNNKG